MRERAFWGCNPDTCRYTNGTICNICYKRILEGRDGMDGKANHTVIKEAEDTGKNDSKRNKDRG